MIGLKLSYRSWFGLFALSLTLFACSDDSKGLSKAHLIDAKETEGDIDLSAEQQRKKEMQYIDLYDTETDTYTSVYQGWVAVWLEEVCYPDDCPASSACDSCQARRALCVAHSIREIIGLTSEPFVFQSGNGARYQIPAQSAAARASLADQGARYAHEAAWLSGQALLNSIYGDPWAESCLPSEAGKFSLTFVDAYHLYKEIVNVAVEDAVAVADAELSSTPSVKTSIARAVTAASLSRAAAAHWLVGGDPGLLGSETGQHWCTQTDLTPEARAAVGVFREAAVSPLAITSTLPIDDLLNGFGFQPGGSVRERLAERWNTAGAPVEQMSGLRTSDFVEARAYLSEEIEVFGRTATGILPERELVGDRQTSFPIYAATAREPSSPDPTYFATLARFSNQDNDTYPDLNNVVPPNLAWFIDAAVSKAHAIVANSSSWNGLNQPVRDALLTPLALLATDGERERRGRFELYIDPDYGWVSAFVGGFAWDEGLRLVRGEDGLRCSTEGLIEGGPCNLEDHTLLRMDTGVWTPDFLKSAIYQNVLTPWEIAEFDGRVYLVRPRNGPAGKAGDFESLGGVTLNISDNSTNWRVLSIVPEAQRRVAELLEPSPRWCARPNTSCAGEPFDVRLPLEDELTDDNDGVESSWKHYLTLAEQAAAEADQLGQEVLQRGLEMDMRAEQAIGELQDLCGTNVDSTVVLNALSGGGAGLTQLTTDTWCGQDSDCSGPPLGAAGRCVASKCMRDPIATVGSTQENADFNRLKECLGDDTVHDFVTPGQRRLCLWHEPGDKNRVCTYPEGTPAEQRMPCPVPVTGDSANMTELCADLHPPPGNYTTVVVDTVLGYFDNNTKVPEPGALGPVCDAIRQVRVQPNAETVKKITASNYFHPDNLRQVGASIGYEARLGSYSAITVNGRPKFSTGDLWGGMGSDWPCTNPRASNCGTQANGLFCYTVGTGGNDGCADPNRRSWRVNANERMAQAVIAIRASTQDREPNAQWQGISWNAMKGVRVPFWTTPLYEQSKFPSAMRLTAGATPTPVMVRSGELELVMKHYRDGGETTALAPGWKSTIDIYSCDGPLKAWCESDGFLTDYCDGCTRRVAGSPHPMQFTIGNVGFLIVHERIDPLAFWSGLSNSAKYSDTVGGVWGAAAGVISSVTSGVRTGHTHWFKDVLTGVRKQGPIASLYPLYDQSIPFVPGSFPAGYEWTRVDSVLGSGAPGDPWYGARLKDFTYSSESLLDGMELLCEVGREEESTVDLMRPFAVSSVDDLEKVKVYLDKLSRELMRRAGTMVFQNFPVRAVDALRDESSQGSYAAVGGQLGVEIAKLRGAVVDLGGVAPLMATEFHLLGLDINELRLTLQRHEVADEIAQVKFLSEVTSQVAACVDSINISYDSIWGASAVCTNSFAQIQFSDRLRDLSGEDTELARQLAVNDFNSRFATRISTLSGLSQRALEDDETIDAALAGIEVLRNQARRALSQALFLDSDQYGEFATNTVMRRHLNVARARYEEARKNAVRMAFFAKRAIELRLGVELRELREDLPLVTAPSTWESTVCESVGVDYEAFRNASEPEPGAPLGGDSIGKFADPYIGSYVTKLRNVIESYRLVNNFHEGTDTAVISLRDDVHNVRADCETPVGNLLYHAGQLDHFANAEAGTPGWEVANCETPAAVGCADGTAEQTFSEGTAVGCAGSVTYTNRNSLCAPGWRVCGAGDWMERRGGAAPTHNYWTNDLLRRGGTASGNCFVSLTEGSDSCGNNPMRVCSANPDPEGNPCEWINCGYDTTTPNEYFGGCYGTAGALCCPETTCVYPSRLDADASDGPFPDLAADLSEVRGYTVAFGPMRTCTSPGNCSGAPCDSANCGLLQSDSALTQRVALTPGEYRLSWYGRFNDFASLDPALAVDVKQDGVSLRPAMLPPPIPAPEGQWARYYYEFAVAEPSEVIVSIQRNPTAPVGPAQVDLAAFMLEDISSAGAPSNAGVPKVFANTSETLTRMLRTCEDTSGDNFRRERWRRECVRLCPDGLSANCTTGTAQTYCYRETHFNVNQRDIESGRILNASSFARGNFNYRIDTIGVNFVGSGIRDCSSSDSPTACNGAGFATYSFEHGGPFYVRNHLGRDYLANLFTGKIEHARGLATERYLTNPLSSADSGLLEQYMRTELRGRPLDGNFVLRVWEEPGVNFDAIDDVQLVLKYRYWTGFD